MHDRNGEFTYAKIMNHLLDEEHKPALVDRKFETGSIKYDETLVNNTRKTEVGRTWW